MSGKDSWACERLSRHQTRSIEVDALGSRVIRNLATAKLNVSRQRGEVLHWAHNFRFASAENGFLVGFYSLVGAHLEREAAISELSVHGVARLRG